MCINSGDTFRSLLSALFCFIYLAESGKCKGVRLQVFHEVLLPVLRLPGSSSVSRTHKLACKMLPQ